MPQKSKKNHPQNLAYKYENRRQRNQIRKLKRHVGRFPDDKQSSVSLALILTSKPGVKGKRTWTTKYKHDQAMHGKCKSNNLFMYKERK